MKRYILKKELPTFKVGAKFELDNYGNLRSLEEFQEFGLLGQNIGIMACHKSTLEKFPNILTDWFEEIPEQPKTVWDLKEGDEYYAISFDGCITHEYINHSSIDYHERVIGIGKCFLTKEEAEKELARRKAKVILERDTKGFQPDWDNNNEPKYEVYYNYNNECLYTCCYEYCCAHQDLWFATAEDAEASIKAHEKEWKIYLGVEE